jgi:two-component system, chemotaxis family, CheB/CheR fusion protein
MDAADLDRDDQVIPRKPQSGELTIVGIGASAGGVQALKEFFENVPEQSGIAYVVILHLSPAFDSKLTEVLQSVAKLPVTKVTERVEAEPDNIYVVPPNQHLILNGNYLTVTSNLHEEERRAPIDILFRTLADHLGPRAICVVLSGTGANGSMGLKRVKELGGAAFVQNPREAEFNEMARNAIATDLIDEVLPVAEIPKRIIGYIQNLETQHISIEAEKRPQDQQHALREIFTQLRARTGHDFSNYKRPTLLRRIERRINVRNLPDLSSYATFIQQNHEETTALLKDLLISVTNFFRDPESFETLDQEVLPKLLKDKTAENQVRIWVAGCATGEEAYSLAMLCAEHTLHLMDAPKIQIFATDIDSAALAQAREGLYTINDAADVSPERLRRFFNREADGYRIRREIREMVLFAGHNFLKDPPFSRLELISCRNVLIYLNQHAQERVLETFNFALNPGGFLFLGSSESADSASDLYSNFNREHHIFQKRQITPAREFPVPEASPTVYLENPVKPRIYFEKPSSKNESITFGELHQRLVEQYAPPSLVVNEEYDIVHLSENAGKYLHLTGGEISQNLLKLVREELRLELRTALYQATQRNMPVEARGLSVKIDNKIEVLNIHVRPVLNPADIAKGYILVVFEQQAKEEQSQQILVVSDEPIAKQLEDELNRLKSRLRSSNEQHEFHAEELRASNEELQAMNEELRSATEELETSKEELQSMNEELRTVNQELKLKVEEAMHTSNNLQNLINSVGIGTIFLDRSLRVAFFTPAARDIFNLIPADYGRSLTDITNRLEYANLIKDVETVLEKLQLVEHEVSSTDGRVFMMQVLPYRTGEDKINGVVITFFDITRRKQAEEGLRRSEEHLRMLIENVKDFAIFTNDENRRISSWNPGAEALIGYAEQEIIGQSSDMIFVPEDREKGDPEKEVRSAIEDGVASNERWHLRKDGSRFYGSGTVRPLRDSKGQFLGCIKIMRDLTEAKKAEEKLRESEERLRITLESAEMGVWDWYVNEDRAKWNKQHYVMLGIQPSEKDQSISYLLSFIFPDDVNYVKEKLKRAVEETDTFNAEFRIMRNPEKEIRWVTGYGRTVQKDSNGSAIRMVGVMYDITERKRLEQQKDEFIGIASHELKTPVTSIKGYAEILQDRFERAKDNESATLMKKLNTQLDRLTNLIRDLLDTTKIVEGNLPLKLSEFDINELIASRVHELQELSKKQKIVFEAKSVKPVTADKERIEQVVTNLITNAIKYSPNNETILVKTDAVDHKLVVSVSDKGIGIPVEFAEKVFDRFFRVSGPQMETFPGMGLGLYISEEIIRRHGGSITVESKTGQGSTFTFTLPYQEKK